MESAPPRIFNCRVPPPWGRLIANAIQSNHRPISYHIISLNLINAFTEQSVKIWILWKNSGWFCVWTTVWILPWYSHLAPSAQSKSGCNKVHSLWHSLYSQQLVQSVQSTLSHLQSPSEQMQSQRNYGSFLSKSHLQGMILFTMLAQNRPKSKRQCF